MNPVVTFNAFSFSYGGKIQALNNISLTVPAGSFTVITGDGGSGKTTLCLAIAGLAPHYFGGAVGGSLLVNGVNTLQRQVAELAETVGIVLEDYESQLVTMTVEEEVAFSLENRGAAPAEISRRVQEALAMVGLTGQERKEIAALSGGQRQRLAIAAVLATRPSILVLDEAASALDPEGAAELYTLLSELNRQNHLTVVLVEHDLAKVLPYATQLVLLQEGSIAAAGPAAKVLRHMACQDSYREGLPALWTLKLYMEQTAGQPFGDWRQEDEAIFELVRYMTQANEVSKNARTA
ncbi:energy-coupling factor ABC transporter ATP-binding protein [Acetonema longum]|uniref:ABC transporter related protein n=1 Tax=Acetonema longum DSM 6540 TaxID=1009370 RepID=F7NJ16_9FIRM|nr:ABC transporter ATP-binding protein [Acetonema longum]EGO64013.1 ABC transporter related protein [Acetonema longum DSM 6540]